jgi:hypothetical protein
MSWRYFLAQERIRRTEPVYSLERSEDCRRVGVASTYERSELVTRDRFRSMLDIISQAK